MLIDISQEVFSCAVYPGDPAPEFRRLLSTDTGAVCNTTFFSMCAHNGTHVDAPFHFYGDGRPVDQMPLESYVGECYVARFEGTLTADDAEEIMKKAGKAGASKRILIAGDAVIGEEAAAVFASHNILLIGNESQTVGPPEAPMNVHLLLLGKGIIILEGVVLNGVEEGKYFLNAAPLNLGGSDGSPCRAWLMSYD